MMVVAAATAVLEAMLHMNRVILAEIVQKNGTPTLKAITTTTRNTTGITTGADDRETIRGVAI